MDANKRVPAEVVEDLQALAVLRRPCTLQFRALNGGVSTLQTTISDVFEDEDGQFLLAANGFTLHLHQLVAINGKPLSHLC